MRPRIEDTAVMQRHRDHWRGYAYGNREKPQDFLDGNMVDRPQTLIERHAAEIGRLRAALEDAVDTLESMDLHVDNPLYDRLRAALEAPSLTSALRPESER